MEHVEERARGVWTRRAPQMRRARLRAAGGWEPEGEEGSARLRTWPTSTRALAQLRPKKIALQLGPRPSVFQDAGCVKTADDAADRDHEQSYFGSEPGPLLELRR